MNVTEQARRAYGAPTHSATRTGRSVEHQLFSQITARLRAACDRDDFGGLVAALHDNRRLWTTLAVDVAGDDNTLPQELRAKIFYLAEYTALHTSRVLRREADALALIDINRAIMSGLTGQAGAA